MKQVDLKGILDKELKFLSVRVYQIEIACLRAMREACNQTVDLCAENVGFIETTSEKLNSEDYAPFITADDNTVWTFNKQSILDTKKQII